jgi:hypothetical protein
MQPGDVKELLKLTTAIYGDLELIRYGILVLVMLLVVRIVIPIFRKNGTP